MKAYSSSSGDASWFFADGDGSSWAWYDPGWDLDGSDGWSLVWDAFDAPDQPGIAFCAYAWDRARNGAGAAAWDVTLDRISPTTAIRSLEPTQDSTAFVVWWDASDNAAGIDRIELQERLHNGEWRPRIERIAPQEGWLYVKVRHWDSCIAGNAVMHALRLEKGYRLYLPLVLCGQQGWDRFRSLPLGETRTGLSDRLRCFHGPNKKVNMRTKPQREQVRRFQNSFHKQNKRRSK